MSTSKISARMPGRNSGCRAVSAIYGVFVVERGRERFGRSVGGR